MKKKKQFKIGLHYSINKKGFFGNTIVEGGIFIKRFFVCSILVIAFIFSTHGVLAQTTADGNTTNNTTNNGTTDTATDNTGTTTNNGTTNDTTGTNNVGTTGTTNNDTTGTNNTNTTGTTTGNTVGTTTDNTTDDGNNLIVNLLYGAGGIVLGSALTYFLSGNAVNTTTTPRRNM